jgi:hypothetical protein
MLCEQDSARAEGRVVANKGAAGDVVFLREDLGYLAHASEAVGRQVADLQALDVFPARYHQGGSVGVRLGV